MVSSTESIENYLKHVYELSLDRTPVKTSHIAEAMDVNAASVTEMIKRLEARKLVNYEPYQGVTLTKKGRKDALAVVRKHRLWEVFLFRVLEVPWTQIHDHACRLEHGTDRQLADILDNYLGFPHHDPHGDPIPGPDGAVEELDRLRLSAIEPETTVTILQCTNENPKMLAHLNSLGLKPGVEVTVLERAPFDGPLTVRVAGTDRAVGKEAARTLLVQTPQPDGRGGRGRIKKSKREPKLKG